MVFLCFRFLDFFLCFSSDLVASHRACLSPTHEGPLWCTTGLTGTHGNRDLLTSTVENLKKGGNTSTHADVQVSLGALDVIVQVVAEGQNNIASALTLAGLVVTGLEKEGGIAVSAKTADASKLGWRVLQVGVARRSTRHVLAELIKEHVTKHNIILIIKVDGEDDDDAVTVLFEPDGLVGAVINLNDLAARCTLSSLLHLLVQNRSKKVAGHARCETGDLGGLFLGTNLEGDADGDIVVGLGAGQEGSVDLLEVLLTSVGLNLVPALALDGNEKLLGDHAGLGISGGVCVKMPENLIEICDCDINFLSAFSYELSVDDIINDTVVRLESQRGCHFL